MEAVNISAVEPEERQDHWRKAASIIRKEIKQNLDPYQLLSKNIFICLGVDYG